MEIRELSDIAFYVEEKISSKNIRLENYVTTDSLRQNKEGRDIARNLPPGVASLTRFIEGDVLMGNIRPYLKKVWQATESGGCSADVLAFRAKENHDKDFLLACLLHDSFYDYVMSGKKGSKMPRGDKSHIMGYKIPVFSLCEEKQIGNIVALIMKKIALNEQLNHNLAPRLAA